MLESLPPKLSKLTSAPYSIQHYDKSKLIFKFVPVQPADGQRVDWDVVFVHVHGIKCTLHAYKSSCSVNTGRARRSLFCFLEVPRQDCGPSQRRTPQNWPCKFCAGPARGELWGGLGDCCGHVDSCYLAAANMSAPLVGAEIAVNEGGATVIPAG